MGKNNKPEEKEEKEKEEIPSIVMVPEDLGKQLPRLRTVGLYGEVNETKSSELIYTMLMMKEDGVYENDDGDTAYEPFECYVSTHGGTAADMFAIYDVMRMIRKDCEIHTIGIGKVMSAGVLLLAAGTKGKRQISENCRVMIHSVSSHHHGSLHELKNELEEVNWIQEQNIKVLERETDMTEEFLRDLMERKTNVYLTAKEAVEYGIADEIV